MVEQFFSPVTFYFQTWSEAQHIGSTSAMILLHGSLTPGPELWCVQSGTNGLKLLGPFSDIIGFVKDDFIRHWLDLLCFLLSGGLQLLLSSLARPLSRACALVT